MKKFYALIVASLAVASVSAANVLTKPSTLRSLEHCQKYDAADIVKIDNNKLMEKQSKLMSKLNSNPASRADEFEVDPTKFTCNMYYDYSFNWTESDGETDADEFRYLRSATNVEIVDNNDFTWTVYGLGGWGFIYNIAQDGDGFYAELGQNIGHVRFSDGSEFDVFLGSRDDDGYITTDGKIRYDAYSNALITSDWAIAYIEEDGKLYYIMIDVLTMLIEPNAYLMVQVENDGEIENVINPVYAEYYESEDDEDPYVMISNVTPWNSGVNVEFAITQTKSGVDIIAAIEQIAYESEYAEDQYGNLVYTGDFYLSTCTLTDMDDEDNEINLGLVLADPVFIDYEGETYFNGVQWPVSNEDLDIVANYWTLFSEYGFCLMAFTPAKLMWDYPGYNPADDEIFNSIKDIAVDANVNAAPVYYNLQGVQVANPAAGQIYIVKEGSKVSKTIIK